MVAGGNLNYDNYVSYSQIGARYLYSQHYHEKDVFTTKPLTSNGLTDSCSCAIA